MENPQKAVVLLSGGLDSTTTLAIAKQVGFSVYAITFNYGQRHNIEISAARRIAKAFRVQEHVVCSIDLRVFGGSALTSDIAVPKERTPDQMGVGIPITYVPARNTIFMSFALAWAEVLQADDIFVGVNAVDYRGYPDCRPEFIEAFQTVANLATKAAVEGSQRMTIHTPLINFTKAEIIRRGIELGVDYGLTNSCYDPTPEGEACAVCDACLLRKRGFSEAGLADPTKYARQDEATL